MVSFNKRYIPLTIYPFTKNYLTSTNQGENILAGRQNIDAVIMSSPTDKKILRNLSSGIYTLKQLLAFTTII